MKLAVVVVDGEPLTDKETFWVAEALNCYAALSLGRMDVFADYMERLLSVELALEPKKLRKIQDLIKKLDSVLWEGRTPWSLYTPFRSSASAVIVHKVRSQLRRETKQVAKAAAYLKMLREKLQLRGEEDDRGCEESGKENRTQTCKGVQGQAGTQSNRVQGSDQDHHGSGR